MHNGQFRHFRQGATPEREETILGGDRLTGAVLDKLPDALCKPRGSGYPERGARWSRKIGRIKIEATA
jgi:hypothetical protein